MPGAILAAIIAASIGNVPLPQKGSTKIRSFFQGVSRISAAAKVSLMGALLTMVRYPLLCRDRPVVSRLIVASSFINEIRMGYSAPVSGNHSTWYTVLSRSTIAFFTIDWMSEGLNSLVFTEDALVTQNFPSEGIYRSHGSAFTLSKSSSNVTAFIFPTFRRIRSAVRRKIFARHTASSSPQKVTLPSST